MIYLIDDNQNRHRENIGINFVNDEIYADILTTLEKIEKRSLSDLSHLNFLKDADCILLHYSTEDYNFANESFISGSRTNVVKIVESIAEEGDKIPLVLFSNGMGEAIIDNKNNIRFIREINKNVFYSRLLDFIEYCKNTGNIEMRILAWGKNYRSKEVSTLGALLLNKLVYSKGDDIFDIMFFADVQLEFQRFIELSLTKDDISVILEDLKNNPVTINEFREKINLIIESFLKYGKNIYPWK